MKKYTSIFGENGKFYYYIFSKGGFTQTLMVVENQGEVTLMTLEDIM